jgi:glycosyltransferase involved in cell wall biosynthesis
MEPIGIVTPWFGKDLTGGAEQAAWQLASRLSGRGFPVEVLTTCCGSFLDDWSTNHHTPGIYNSNGYIVRRFSVDSRKHREFDRLNRRLLDIPVTDLKPGIPPVPPDQSAVFARENINSAALLSYLSENKDRYRLMIFIPYLYGPIINGLPIVAENAYLQPCLHSEVYAYLPEIAFLFRSAKGILFNSEGERLLAQRLYGPGVLSKSMVVGIGVEIGDAASNEADKAKILLEAGSRYVLCLGRRDPTKNIRLILSAYARFRSRHPESGLRLVLAGPGKENYGSPEEGVIDCGFVDDQYKIRLLSGCTALFQPSHNESYSRVIMEAWFFQKPVVAHRSCLATATAVSSASGGWLADAEPDWTEMFAKIDAAAPDVLAETGRNGKQYAEIYANWDSVIDRYEKIIASEVRMEDRKSVIKRKNLSAVHQVLESFAYGDAVSNHATALRKHLRSLGYESQVFVRCVDSRLAGDVRIFNLQEVPHEAGLLYHHSIGSDLSDFAARFPGPKCLIYHNITPADFFRAFRPDYADILEKGRTELARMASCFPVSIADSLFNAEELKAFGYPEPWVVPIAVSPDAWNHILDPRLMSALQDGATNILFAGRIAPNKCQHQLVEAFYHYLAFDPYARLIIVGYFDSADPYYLHLKDTIRKFGLIDHVVLSGQVSHADLQAYYQTAHLFWSMSEHEGFCIPLIEAMWFDVPVLAYSSSAVPETMGKAGILFNCKEDYSSLSALAKRMIHDEELKKKILSAQRERRNDFLPEKIHPLFDNLIERLENQSHEARSGIIRDTRGWMTEDR